MSYYDSGNRKSTAQASASVGIPVFWIAFFILLILKVAGLNGASWGLASLSWWWVFSPLLIGLGLVVFWLVVIFLVVLVLKD